MANSSSPFPRPRDWWLLLAFLAFILFFYLGVRGLNEPDEGRYASMGMTMAQPGGNWWEPRMSGYAHYDKPPLLYWMTAFSFRVFGFNEWAARLPCLFGAVAALVGLGWTAWRLRGARVAWWAVLICGTSIQFWTIARILSPDMLLTGWCTLAIGAWAECRHRASSWNYWLLSLLFWSLAWWTKATPALIPLAGLAAGVWLTGDVIGKRSLRLAWLLPAILVVGSPWYLSMLHRYPELRKFFFGRELAGRLAGHADGRRGSKFYYIPISLLAWLPWWPCGAWIIWRERVRLFTGDFREIWLAWSRRIGVEGWIVLIGLIIFSLAGSKLPTYTLTLAPWAALGLARLVAQPAFDQPKPFLLVAIAFAMVMLTVTVFLPPTRENRLDVNSSLREVCRFLSKQGARRVDTDRYWPGMEFYLGADKIHYVVRASDPPDDKLAGPSAAHRRRKIRYRERDSDSSVPPDRFIDPDAWPLLPANASSTATSAADSDWWLVHFRKQQGSTFDGVIISTGLDNKGLPAPVRIGDFVLYHMSNLP